ncbi:MAG: long-chain fatty acid--CoA ligase [Verrucomicrobiales bacterium]|nr:long-chain fatty acid--CoA ligase [Verrucomicrobiales bacterium]
MNLSFDGRIVGPMQLFDQWQRTRQARGTALAVRCLRADGSLPEDWTFDDLQRHLDARPVVAAGEGLPVTAGQGVPELLLTVLTAWRDGAVLMPLESTDGVIERLGHLPPDTVHIKTTSGSTGRPQRIAFTGAQLAADARAILATMALDLGAPNLVAISATHSYGFSNLVLPLLLHGMPLWVPPSPLPAAVRAAFDLARQEQLRLTLPAVPALWRSWHQAGVLAEAPVATAISAGAPMPLELECQIFEQTGLKVHNFYGSSECGGIAYDDSPQPRTDAHLVGRAMAGVTLDLDPDGCLRVSGAAVAQGYLDAGPAVAQRLGAGSFLTTDLADLSGGEVRLIGRQTECINVAGRKISPAEIEHALLRLPLVQHCLVFGVPSHDPARVEEIVACVNVDPRVPVEELRRGLAAHLPTWQQPRHWWMRPDLVPDARGKLPRSRWRLQFLAEEAEARGLMGRA